MNHDGKRKGAGRPKCRGQYAENKEFKPIEIKEGNEIFIWGVVTNVIHAV